MISNANLRAHRIAGLKPGPRLIVTGAVHGNETAGTRHPPRAGRDRQRRHRDRARQRHLRAGVQPAGLQPQRRMGERNLNRRLQPTATPQDNEDRIAGVLCKWLAEHDVLLDLHSFRSPGQPFVMRGPADNRGTLEPFAHAAAEGAAGRARGPEPHRRRLDAGLCRRRGAAQGARPDARRGARRPELRRGHHRIHAQPGRLRHHAGMRPARRPGRPMWPTTPSARRWRCWAWPTSAGAAGAALRMPGAGRSGGPPRRGRPLRQDLDQLRPAGRGRADRGARRWQRSARAQEAGYIVFPDVSALPGHEWFYLAQRSQRPL
jgi:hypothetical protein